MNTYYCVFWFPTIFHREKVSCFRTSKKNEECVIPSVSIADDDTKSNFFLKIKEEKQIGKKDIENEGNTPATTKRNIEEDKYDLIFTLSTQDNHEFSTRFECVNQTRNGFVVYSYDRDKLIKDYWGRFENGDLQKIIANARERVISRIKKKYPSAPEPNPDDVLIKNYMIDRILISFYHHAKLFYHEHETHYDSDGKYISYYYTNEHENGVRDYLREAPSLSKKNNPVINWYIEQFEERIVENAENISRHYKNWSAEFEGTLWLKRRVNNALKENSINDILYLIGEIRSRKEILAVESGEENPPDILGIEDVRNTTNDPKVTLNNQYRDSIVDLINYHYDGLSALAKECTDSLIEYTYCKTLLESKYNDLYKHNRYFTKQDLKNFLEDPNDPNLLQKDYCRKKAFNIRNSIRYIEDIKQKCDIEGVRITEMLIEEVHGISKDSETILGRIKKLTEETAESNSLSSFLGWLSLAIAIFSLGGLFQCTAFKLVCLAVAVAVFVICYFFVPKIKKKKTSKSNTSNGV